MNNIKFIIFDLDGTLIDSSDGVVEAVNYSLTMMGEQTQHPDKIKPFIGFPLQTMYPHFSKKPIDELYRHFQIKAAETVVSSTIQLDAVEPTLQELKNSGYTLSIASTKIKEHISGVIEKFDWHELITAYSGGNEVAEVKPAPDIFHLTMQKLSADKTNSIVVGDTINDVVAAQKAGLPVIAVRSPYGNVEELKKSKPDYIVDSITEIKEIIDTL